MEEEKHGSLQNGQKSLHPLQLTFHFFNVSLPELSVITHKHYLAGCAFPSQYNNCVCLEVIIGQQLIHVQDSATQTA